MKKIFLIIVIVIIAVVGYFGFNYWNETYNSTAAYAIVPETIPEKLPTKDNTGEVQEGLYSYTYEFKFVKENGDTQTMEYSITGENPEPLTPNTYVKAEISKKRVTSGPSSISESDVPDNVMKIIQN